MQIKQQHRGISLLEVLAAIFVVAIGLLGVLAVIPFGALQVTQANHAKYASNMLANAAEEVRIRDMMNPEQWRGDDLQRVGAGWYVLPSPIVLPQVVVTPQTESVASGGISGTATTTFTIERTEINIRAYPLASGGGNPSFIEIEITITSHWRASVVFSHHASLNRTIPGVGATYEHVDRRSFVALYGDKFIWFEAHEQAMSEFAHIFPIAAHSSESAREALIRRWAEPMRGQDDLVYTTHANRRPDFSGQEDRIQSSGRYTWFFTFLPSFSGTPLVVDDGFGRQYSFDFSTGTLVVDWPETGELWPFAGERFPDLNIRADWIFPEIDRPFPRTRYWGPRPGWPPLVRNFTTHAEISPFHTGSNFENISFDVLACHSRVPGDDVQVTPRSFLPSLGGGTFTLPNTNHLARLTETNYVFVTWGAPRPPQVRGGAWCKIVFVDGPRIVVTGDLQDIRENDDIRVYIPSGVLFHKRVH